MIFALATAFLFAGSAICGKQATERAGSLEANFWRLVMAAVALAVITFALYPQSFSGPTFFWLFVSGLIGFGLGDVALYLAFARIGSRLTLLLNFCLAIVFGTVGDWVWLGDRIGLDDALFISVIMVGLALALLGAKPRMLQRTGSFGAGIIAGILAAFGQGFGATISRHAQKIANESDLVISGISQAFQRVVPGMLIGGIALFVVMKRRPQITRARISRTAFFWMAGAAFFGPVAGVSCFQWALEETQSGIVLAISATAPLVIIPFAAVFEKDRPTPAAITGAVIAVSGVVGLCLAV